MHIAVCDDNIADRKQTERLLSREIDVRRDNVNAIYVDSYGSVESLLQSPMSYDVFYIDYHSNGYDSIKIAAKLREIGTIAPIWICGADDMASTSAEIENLHLEHVYTLPKPILKAELAKTLDIAKELKAQVLPPVEIRGLEETFYLQEEEIAFVHCMDHQIELHRTNGDIDYINGVYDDAFHSLENHPLFLFVGKHYILNMRYVEDVRLTSVEMQNGESFMVSLRSASTIKKIKADLKKQGLI